MDVQVPKYLYTIIWIYLGSTHRGPQLFGLDITLWFLDKNSQNNQVTPHFLHLIRQIIRWDHKTDSSVQCLKGAHATGFGNTLDAHPALQRELIPFPRSGTYDLTVSCQCFSTENQTIRTTCLTLVRGYRAPSPGSNGRCPSMDGLRQPAHRYLTNHISEFPADIASLSHLVDSCSMTGTKYIMAVAKRFPLNNQNRLYPGFDL